MSHFVKHWKKTFLNAFISVSHCHNHLASRDSGNLRYKILRVPKVNNNIAKCLPARIYGGFDASGPYFSIKSDCTFYL